MNRQIIIASALLLTGCVSLPAATPPPVIPAPVVPVPPPCVKYTDAQIKDLGAALAVLDAAKLAGYQTIDGFLTDYHNMRVAQGCQQ